MKITVQFDSLEEFQEHMIQHAGAGPQVQIEPSPVKTEIPADTLVAGKMPTPAEPDPEPVQITEDFRAEVRRAMATLNKQTGENTAKKILQERGFASLKDAPLEALPELMETVRGMVK